MSRFGEEIKKYRTKYGLTQKDFSNLIGYTFQAVSKWELEDNVIPDMKAIIAVSSVINVPIDTLFADI